MRSFFGKYLIPFIVLVSFQAIIIVVVILDVFRGSNDILSAIFDFFSGWSSGLTLFNFIADTAAVISGVVICLVAALFFIRIRRIIRSHAFNKVHKWSQNAVVILAQYREDRSEADYQSGWFDDLRIALLSISADSGHMLFVARILGGELGAKIKKAVSSLEVLEEKTQREDRSVFKDLQYLQHDLADVMIDVFESSR
jgi:hypothetical protein